MYDFLLKFFRNWLILFIEGKVIVRNLYGKDNSFETAIDDYYNGKIDLNQKLEEKDLERMKIALSWLVKNRSLIKVYYLKEYTSREELEKLISLH